MPRTTCRNVPVGPGRPMTQRLAFKLLKRGNVNVSSVGTRIHRNGHVHSVCSTKLQKNLLGFGRRSAITKRRRPRVATEPATWPSAARLPWTSHTCTPFKSRRAGFLQVADFPSNGRAYRSPSNPDLGAARDTPAWDAAVESMAAAIFRQRPAAVMEAYSAFGRQSVELHSAHELCAYASSMRSLDGYEHLAVLYPDMAGAVTRARIDLDPSECGGHTYRYEAQGWGLIWVYLKLSPAAGRESFVSANSEARALAWAPHYPDMGAPSTWHWPSVARHLRRLRRALKRTD